MTAGLVLRVDDRAVPVSSLDRVLYPMTGTTKAEVMDYCARVAPYSLRAPRSRCR